ncbi:hypothetical protein [Clostridium omnivorum]|uniref:Uncharacterized protein n=1 Tax=Clostridium omnivorum TaxID=1604902 RepID=A0ABQ5N700_9CLOT|nr:hypothetical protein [Clostridium sp. E14]GLC30986.1 hypothetical protein bsdE14_23960 [Clostridium sp. E14]
MEIIELRKRIGFINSFIEKLDRETLPSSDKKVMLRLYASTLKINLTDNLINNIIKVSH